MCSLRDAAEDLKSLGATPYGVSRDDVATLAKFAEQESLRLTLLSDPDGSATAKYAAGLGDRPFAARHTFVLDPQGVLRHVDRAVKPDAHGRDLVERIRALQAEDAAR
jgi:peroxiredoxin Q/BCP